MIQPTVLLVDDDVTQRKLARLRLRDAGYNVVTATCGDEALAKATHLVPNVVLSDVLMDGMDGFALCRRLREDPTLVTVPIILLSAHYQSEPDQALAAKVGAFALVRRTPDFQEELATLRRSLDIVTARGDGEPPVTEHSASQQLAKLIDKARSAEQRYRVLFETAHDAIAMLSEEGVILEVNERWRSLLGIAPDELVGRHIREFAAPGYETDNVDGFRSASQWDGRARATLRHSDGRLLRVEFSNSTIEIQGRRMIVSICHDVTVDFEAARKLAAAESRYRSLIERLPDVIWTCSSDGRVVFITQNIVELTGYSAEEQMHVTFEQRLERIHPEDAVAVSRAVRTYVERGDRFDIEYRSRRPDGRWIWLRNRATARYERDGEVFMEGLLSDVTERKSLEQSFRQAQKMEAIGQLTGGIAHDFNNILGAILASAEFLLESIEPSDARYEDAAEIVTATQRGASLTRQLLAFSRRQHLDPKILVLDKTVLSMERLLRRVLTEDVELAVIAGAADSRVRVDESQLEQVLMNLVVNARDAMPMGGRLVVETACVVLDEAAGAQIDVPPGRYARLVVSDTGTGMDEPTRHKMFEPFFTTKPVGKGTGLGLSTVYGIIKQSGGYIGVESEEHHGTSFIVYLPWVEPARSVEPAVVPSGGLRGSETILLVEDDERVRAVVRRILVSLGYRVLTAVNGQDALDLVRATTPAVDLVLTDVMMPGMHGPELAVALRERYPDILTIFMSGHTTDLALDEADLANMMRKPFGHDVLARKLRDVLDGPRAIRT